VLELSEERTGVGDGALNAGGDLGSTAVGYHALFNATTSGQYNTATGAGALESSTTGGFNTANGAGALSSNTIGGNNTAIGVSALTGNTTGNDNTAIGVVALIDNTTGSDNTATGYQALYHNTVGGGNTATGMNALVSNTTGVSNTAIGFDALFSNTISEQNTAIGYQALYNSTGNFNTATGWEALLSNTNDGNTAIGYGALLNNTTGFDNVALGLGAGFNQTNGADNVYIGTNMQGVAGENNACYIGSIFNQLSSGGTPVVINSAGKLGTITSSRRFKDDIKPMDKASDMILALKPVTFHYKKEIDPKGVQQFGLVAEEVEAVNPDLVVRDKEGKVNTVRYEAINAMLLNEFLKEHETVQEQGATITQQRKDFEATLAQQQKQIEALTAGLRKVSAQLEASKPAQQVVENNR
jgi:hypothetical protein